MRMIIKNADFSEVSIGKVEKDLSFEFKGLGLKDVPWKNVIDKTAALPWNPSSNVSRTDYYIATNGDADYTLVTNNKDRIVTELIEVVEGMVITTNLKNTANCPLIICYDADEQPLGPSETDCLWKISDYGTTATFTIPSTAKYIVINISEVNATMVGRNEFIKAAMP